MTPTKEQQVIHEALPMTACELISDPARFTTGTLSRDASGNPSGLSEDSVQFDCLGALLWCYPQAGQREPVAKRAFDLCQARFDHKRLGRLDHQEAVELLRDVGA